MATNPKSIWQPGDATQQSMMLHVTPLMSQGFLRGDIADNRFAPLIQFVLQLHLL